MRDPIRDTRNRLILGVFVFKDYKSNLNHVRQQIGYQIHLSENP